MVFVVLLALIAGVTTTVAGMGGGLIFVIGLSTFVDPLTALTVTSPALLVGNLHRLWLYRSHVDGKLGTRLALGGAPAALVGALVAVAVPEGFLRASMVLLAGLAVVKLVAGLRFEVPPAVFVPGGAAVGFVSATSGGGGLLAGPLLLSAGLSGRRYVGTGALGAASIHLGRITGYGVGGAVDEAVLSMAAVAAVCIALGNLAGDRLRRIVPERLVPRLEVGVVVAGVGLALVGLT
jgi:uncharacterized protein